MTIFASAVLGHDGRPLDQIRLTGVTATGHHGVLPHERVEGQEFRADVVLHLDTRPAAVGDELDATVSYADVAQDVHDVLAGSPADLIETVAERVAAAVLARPGVVAVDVRVHKPHAPIAVPFDDVEVAIRRDHAKAPVVEWPTAAVSEPEPPRATLAPLVPAVAAAVAAEPAIPAAPQPAVEAMVAPVDRLELDPADPVEVVLGIGANLGDPQATLRAAVSDLDRIPGIEVTEVSPLARTTPVGGPADQPDYLNAIVIARTTLSPRGLLRATQSVEDAHGRVREERWGPRTLDIDIVGYGHLVARADDLELPHPRAHERAFVLVPWAQVQPDADLPGLGGGPVAQLAETAPDRAGIRWLALDWLAEPPAPEAAAQEPVVPEPVVPEPVAPEPVVPEPFAPELVAPEPVAPEPFAPAVVTPESIAPELIAPELIAPEAIVPAPVVADPVVAEPVVPVAVASETVAPEQWPVATPPPVPVAPPFPEPGQAPPAPPFPEPGQAPPAPPAPPVVAPVSGAPRTPPAPWLPVHAPIPPPPDASGEPRSADDPGPAPEPTADPERWIPYDPDAGR
ncbi:2-amino-4-hydroxy-6-hydroxymethyldihydropteridine diphosphokinase [Xylanimonas ulmi]|uniref:Bifunctional folate synthesis protein n=1 Tax=Xylanimonas ulmi TaxID=228973 RepID=A0A4Q7M447_9MICO|nr:2-amino-4-hydroxy-6-hydroxymethyldihydropteridine diphosphokinase [Xylanibacterium ulmi]RZS62131.1 dihydroneopterin aldolase/2-amino-4-hydroxy-6-hydroxymethyldihydropteridine diphosphokinase [Xylanibacterium ulmi]